MCVKFDDLMCFELLTNSYFHVSCSSLSSSCVDLGEDNGVIQTFLDVTKIALSATNYLFSCISSEINVSAFLISLYSIILLLLHILYTNHTNILN